jgi:POT family proton-dependent oligopeptide transporter
MARLKDFPATFWIANTMEIFERMAWYGFYAVSSLYITGSVESGGLGFSETDRGVLQGVVTFFLYLFPVVTGALADRFGFKKMLFAAYLVLAPAYYLLGQFKTFPTFFLAFMLVAVGAAMFKPVIVGTISKVTNKNTASMGFGIFYMMVNIGGFVGPVVAGIVRAISWEYVFIASGGWMLINIILLNIFYKEPETHGGGTDGRSMKTVFSDMVEVLGNGRFFLLVFVVLFVLVMGSKYSLSWGVMFGFIGGWILLNFLIDIILRKARFGENRLWLLQPMRLGDWRFGLFLLLLSTFWTGFNQIFLTLPLYIRDYVDTADLMSSFVGFFSMLGMTDLARTLPGSMAVNGQVNPEYIINFNAGGIILFQVVVSYLVTRLKPFTTIFWGVLITAVSFMVLIFGSTGWIVVGGIMVFSFGEMMASPKAKEYTGMIAPPNKIAMYMGYFFWSTALGNLFGGLLSGQMYNLFGVEQQRPDLMWLFFALFAVASAGLIFLYDRMVIRKIKQQEA